jgi:hypothetical protein
LEEFENAEGFSKKNAQIERKPYSTKDERPEMGTFCTFAISCPRVVHRIDSELVIFYAKILF